MKKILLGMGSLAAVVAPVAAVVACGNDNPKKQPTVSEKLNALGDTTFAIPSDIATGTWASSLAYASTHSENQYGSDFANFYREKFTPTLPTTIDSDIQGFTLSVDSFNIIPSHNWAETKLEIEYHYVKDSNVSSKKTKTFNLKTDMHLSEQRVKGITTKASSDLLSEIYWLEGMSKEGIQYSSSLNPFSILNNLGGTKGLPIHISDLPIFKSELLEGSDSANVSGEADLKNGNYDSIIDLRHMDNEAEYNIAKLHLTWDLAYQAVLENKSTFKIGIAESKHGKETFSSKTLEYNTSEPMLKTNDANINALNEIDLAKDAAMVFSKHEASLWGTLDNAGLSTIDPLHATLAQINNAISLSNNLQRTMEVKTIHPIGASTKLSYVLAEKQGILIVDFDVTTVGGSPTKTEHYTSALSGFLKK